MDGLGRERDPAERGRFPSLYLEQPFLQETAKQAVDGIAAALRIKGVENVAPLAGRMLLDVDEKVVFDL